MKQAWLFFIALSSIFYVGCQQGVEDMDYSTLTVQSIDPTKLNRQKVEYFVDKLLELQKDGILSDRDLTSVGNAKEDYDFVAAVLIAKQFTPTGTDESLSEKSVKTLYKYAGSRARKYRWWGCYVYKAWKGSTLGYGCSILDSQYNLGVTWVNRSQINCTPIPVAQKEDCN